MTLHWGGGGVSQLGRVSTALRERELQNGHSQRMAICEQKRERLIILKQCM